MDADTARTVVVLTALDLEYQAVRAHLTKLRKRPHPAGTLFEVGWLPGGRGRIAIAVTGEGNPGAAVLAERAITMFQPRALLFVGVAGALKNDIDLGDVVVATKVYAYQGGKDEDEGFQARPRAWEAPHELDQLARYIARASSWAKLIISDSPRQPPTVHFKPIAAGEVLLNSRDTPLAQQLLRTYGDAAAVEMESAGVSQAGHLNRSLPVLIIRGISDKADGLKHVTDHAGWQPTAAANAAAFALTLAAEIFGHGDTDTSGVGGADPVFPAYAFQPESVVLPAYAFQPESVVLPAYAFQPESVVFPAYAFQPESVRQYRLGGPRSVIAEGEPEAARHYSIMVIEVEDFDTQLDAVRHSMRGTMLASVRQAAADAKVPFRTFVVRNGVSGMLVLVPPPTSAVPLAGDFVRALDARLADQARAVRLRVALHHGLVARDGNRWTGEPLDVARRLVNAAPVREILATATRSRVALLVSDDLFRAVIRPGGRSVDASTFERIRVESADAEQTVAWVHVPGYPAPPGVPAYESTAYEAPAYEAPERAEPDSPSRTSTPQKSERTGQLIDFGGNTTIHGDFVAGPKTVYNDGSARR